MEKIISEEIIEIIDCVHYRDDNYKLFLKKPYHGQSVILHKGNTDLRGTVKLVTIMIDNKEWYDNLDPDLKGIAKSAKFQKTILEKVEENNMNPECSRRPPKEVENTRGYPIIPPDGSIKEYKRTEEEESQMGQKTAARFSKGKVRHDLIPPWVIDQLALVYTYGAQKYDDDNWRKGLKWRKDVIGPLLRHLWKWIRGEKLDDESNCHHLAMVLWNACALMEYERCSIGIDDRNPYDLSMMDEKERENRIKLWLKHAHEDDLESYNGLEIDDLEQK